MLAVWLNPSLSPRATRILLMIWFFLFVLPPSTHAVSCLAFDDFCPLYKDGEFYDYEDDEFEMEFEVGTNNFSPNLDFALIC